MFCCTKSRFPVSEPFQHKLIESPGAGEFMRLKFVEPLLPTLVEKPPEGDEWLQQQGDHRHDKEQPDQEQGAPAACCRACALHAILSWRGEVSVSRSQDNNSPLPGSLGSDERGLLPNLPPSLNYAG